ncbi:MAG: hypothetical protein BZY65_01805 [SAR202 cluster bacterium Ae2-Chloro-G2]|nr:MAG: hypothetical protein BZY65_01805 [SAR202 cluster bacterium Ae2-Chloro-G2]
MTKSSQTNFRAYFTLIPVMAGVFFAADDQTVVVTILPQIMSDLRVEVSELHRAGWTVTGYLLGYVAIMPITGRLSDILGRRTVYAIAMVVFVIGSTGTALTGSFGWMYEIPVSQFSSIDSVILAIPEITSNIEWVISTRILQAIGAGALVPVSIAMVSDLFKANQRGVPLGITGAAAEAGAVIGPLWGGVVTRFLDWQWVFWLNLPVAAAVLLGIYLMFPKTVRIQVPVDYLGSVFIVVGLCLLTLGFSQSDNLGKWMYLYFGTGTSMFAAYAVRALSISDPIIPITLFRNIGFTAANMVHILYGAGLIITMVTIPLMANTILQGSPLDGGLMLGRLTVVIPAGAIVGGFICKNHDLRIPSILGLVLCSISLFIMSGWDQTINDPWMTIPLVTAGFGFGLLIAPITLAALNSTNEAMKGAASGIISTSRFIGMTFGIAALSAWGAGKFQDSLSGIELPLPSPSDTAQQIAEKSAQFQIDVTDAGVNLFSDFYFAGAVVCLIAILPCISMKVQHPNS